MAAPHSGNLVKERLCRMRIGGYDLDRKVRRDERVSQGSERNNEEHELGQRRLVSKCRHHGVMATRRHKQRGRLHHRDKKREKESKVTDLWRHMMRSLPLTRDEQCARPRLPLSSRGFPRSLQILRAGDTQPTARIAYWRTEAGVGGLLRSASFVPSTSKL